MSMRVECFVNIVWLRAHPHLFPQWLVWLLWCSLSLNTICKVIGGAVVKGIWIHEYLIQLIKKSLLQAFLFLVLFYLGCGKKAITRNSNFPPKDTKVVCVIRIVSNQNKLNSLTLLVHYEWACERGSITLVSNLFLDGNSNIRLDLTQSFHQELGVIWRLSDFLWIIYPKVVLLTKLEGTKTEVKPCCLYQHQQSCYFSSLTWNMEHSKTHSVLETLYMYLYICLQTLASVRFTVKSMCIRTWRILIHKVHLNLSCSECSCSLEVLKHRVKHNSKDYP